MSDLADWRVDELPKGPYRLPRAVHLDGEIMRLLQSLGLAETLAQRMLPVPSYEWFGADGEAAEVL
jgi:hypothetical protein